MQCFVKKDFFTPTFEKGKFPKLLYVCKAEADLTKLPCVMHMHEDWLEILFIRQGKGIHTIGGRQHQTKKGDILIYNSGVLHDERTRPGSEMSVYNCAVTNLKLEGLRENCLLLDSANPVLHSGEFSQDIENIFRIMHSQINSKNTGVEEICHYLLYSLITIIFKQIDRTTKTEENEKNEEYIVGNRIKKYIDDYYFEELTLEKISKALCISTSYLCHVFKRTTGYTPIQYVTYRRIGKAQSLLLNTQYSATVISSMVGYENSNYFNTIFTKNVGMSPIEYRKCWVSIEHTDKGNFNKKFFQHCSL